MTKGGKKMPFLESIVMAGGSEITKAVAAGLVKKAGAIFWEKRLEPLLKNRSAKRQIIDGAKRYVSRVDKATKAVPTVAVAKNIAPLSEIYVPLTLVDSSADFRVRLEKYPDELFERSTRILLTDTAGMGKSTTLKFLVQTALIDLKVLPVLVELRRIKPSQTLIDFVAEEFCGIANDDCRRMVADVLEGEAVLLLLDGYDEVDDSLRKQINSEICELSSRAEDCVIVVASRPDSELKSLAGFSEMTLQPLTQAEAFQLLGNYDKKGDTAARLIAKVTGNQQISEFLGNPLMVSLLYKAFNFKNTVPFKRNIFFRQVYDALYQDHDLSKGGGYERQKRTGLDIEDFHKVLRALGITTYFVGRVQYEAEKFHQHLIGAKTVSSVAFDPPKMRADLLSAVPLFVKDGADIRWAHKAFQDYFTAQYIYTDAPEALRQQLLERLMDEANPRRHENVLLILSDLDRGLVRKLAVAPVVRRLLAEYEASRFNGRPHGFRLFQYTKAGEVVRLSPDYASTVLMPNWQGFDDLLDKMRAAGGGVDMSRAHITHGFGSVAHVVFETYFVDTLALINTLEGEKPRPASRRYGADNDKVFGVASGVDVQPLSPLLASWSNADLIDKALDFSASLMSVKFLEESYARNLVSDVNRELPPNLAWLLSVLPKDETT